MRMDVFDAFRRKLHSICDQYKENPSFLQLPDQ
jgi:hypothetical protein